MRLSSLFVTIFAVLALATPVSALHVTDFTPEAYDTARASGERYILNFHAPWCPTCRKQTEVLKSLQQNPELEKFTSLTVDYDSADDLKKKFKVSRQSTMIILEGDKEISRRIGVTDKNEVRNLLLE